MEAFKPNPLIVRCIGLEGNYGAYVFEYKGGELFLAHIIKTDCPSMWAARIAARKYQAEPRNFTLIPLDGKLEV